MAKFNSAIHGSNRFLLKQGNRNNLFNLKSFNELKKDQTNIQIFKNSSFDSSFNSVQSLNTNLSQLLLLPSPDSFGDSLRRSLSRKGNKANLLNTSPKGGPAFGRGEGRNTKNIKNFKFSAILRAIRSIRLNRDEWKLIRYINLMGKKLRSSPFFGCFAPAQSLGKPKGAPLPILSSLKRGRWAPLSPSPAAGKEKAGSLLRGKQDSGIKILKKRKLNLDKIKILQSVNPCLGRETKPTPVKVPTPPFYLNLFTNKDNCHRQGEVNKYFYIKQNNKKFSNNNIISKNILLRNMKYNFLNSTLSSILKKKIRKISEVLEDKPIKNYVLYSYLKNCISSLRTLRFPPNQLNQAQGQTGTPNHLNIPACLPPTALAGEAGGGRTKLSLNKYKGRKFGSFINYNKIIEYKFSSTFYQVNKFGLEKSRGNKYIKDTYKLLFYLFKSMYCLISKPVLKYSNDKVIIQLFYYLNIPKKKVFRLFSISYISSMKKKWLALIEKKTGPLFSYPPFPAKAGGGNLINLKVGGVTTPTNSLPSLAFGKGRRLPKVGNTKIYIRWKLRKAISRLKNKIIPSYFKPKGSGQTESLTPLAFASKQGQKNLLFKLRKFNLTAKTVFQKKFKLICAILSNKFNKPVELQLIRLHHPYHDSNILVNLLSLNIKNKRKKARVAVQKIYNKKPVKNINDPNLIYPSAKTRLDKQGIQITPTALAGEGGNFIPAFLSGLNIKIAGRLMREPIIPRITKKVFGKGATAIGKVNYLDVARITKKNRKGAYTIKITSGQNFF
jgi:hypothetical protein